MKNSENPKSLGTIIREARVRTDQSLREVAKALGLAPSYLSDIENDRRIPSEEVLQKTATHLNLNFDELMALAGRFGTLADQYLKRTPAAGRLLRRLADQASPTEDIDQLDERAKELAKKRKDDRG